MQDDRITVMPLDPALARPLGPNELPPIDPSTTSTVSWRCPERLHDRVTITLAVIASIDPLTARHLGAKKGPTFRDLSGAALAVGVIMAWPLGFVSPMAPQKTPRVTTRFLSQWLRVATCSRMHTERVLTAETLMTATDSGVIDHPRLCSFIDIGLDHIEDDLAHMSDRGTRSLVHPTGGLFGRLGLVPALKAISQIP